MQITIDTLKDSKDDIRKAIRMLMALAAEQGSPSGNFFDNTPPSDYGSPQPAPALGSFFDNIEQQPASAPGAKKDRPRIELF